MCFIIPRASPALHILISFKDLCIRIHIYMYLSACLHTPTEFTLRYVMQGFLFLFLSLKVIFLQFMFTYTSISGLEFMNNWQYSQYVLNCWHCWYYSAARFSFHCKQDSSYSLSYPPLSVPSSFSQCALRVALKSPQIFFQIRIMTIKSS